MTKVKKVELIELFFDLIYVYAISKLSEIIHHVGFDGLTFSVLIKYLIAAFVILQGWLYLTNYVNRFGKNSFIDYVGIIVNMFITIYLSNTITTDWVQMYFSFNLAMFLMLLSVCALYFFQKKTNQKG
ncbi:low temperature requirement protein A [Enterococcus sp. HY326]|uniref:low temperature requirement protein A n=1 Tax=Enterococcus sp. HY326 TaxID=2971265 RepID=UPI00223FECDA|nr:low temperature requirement protein A [Enterococcus sp. HY326]